MKMITIKRFLLFSLAISLFWCLYITYHYPYMGVDLKPNSNEEWIVSGLGLVRTNIGLDIELGDRIISVNGEPADQVASIQKWRVVEQAKDITISRSGRFLELHIENGRSTNFDLFQLFSGLFCLLMALILYVKMRSSKSAKLLSSIFLSGGAIYLSLG